MNFLRTLNTRLVFSHLVVSTISIILMAVFAGQSIFQAATAEAEHNLQALAFAAGNALELPIQELQFNVVKRKTLVEAQKRPERHRNLVVRVAGYSAFFNDLDRSTQDDIIGRTEQTFA